MSASGERPVEALKVLISAYACGPNDEPEASAGWAFARAAAQGHQVWVITRRRFQSEISQALDGDPDLSGRLHVLYLDLPEWVLRFRRGPGHVYWYYMLWQRALATSARRLHQRERFDVAHHVTFAADWLPCGVSRVRELPLVWGPVGGATYLPWPLLRWLGWRGVLGEVARSSSTRVARRLWADSVARRAALVVGQNRDTARRFSSSRRTVVEPNAALRERDAALVAPLPAVDGAGVGEKVAVFVGRLVPWKGARLAVTALSRPELDHWRIDIYGAGPDEFNLRRLAGELGLSARVIFKGHRPRAEVLAAFEQCDAMIFPSMHDSAGWAVGEASAAGCPVVCLDVGGPPLLAGPNAHVVAIRGDVVRHLADALARAGSERGTPYDRWSVDRLPALVDKWYADAATSAGRDAEVST